MKHGEIEMISCAMIRSTVILSAGLFLSGLLLLLVAETTGLAVPTAHIALLAVLGGALTLAAASILAILPNSGRNLHNCQH
jgi:hypothetical protein